jgi:hypothetical protein
MRHISSAHGLEAMSKRMNRAFAQDVMAVKKGQTVAQLLNFWRRNFLYNLKCE